MGKGDQRKLSAVPQHKAVSLRLTDIGILIFSISCASMRRAEASSLIIVLVGEAKPPEKSRVLAFPGSYEGVLNGSHSVIVLGHDNGWIDLRMRDEPAELQELLPA